MVIDARSDHGLQLISPLLATATLPNYVRQSTDEEYRGLGSKMASQFAAPSEQSLPCGTKAACFLSHMYYLTQRNELHEPLRGAIASKLARFAKLHRIEQEVQQLVEQYDRGTHKMASATTMNRTIHWRTRNIENEFKPSVLMAAASELYSQDSKTAGADLVGQWYFDQQFNNLSGQIAAIAVERPDKRAAIVETAKLANSLSPRKQLARLPEIADILADFCETKGVRVKLATWPKYNQPVVRIDGRIHTERSVLSHLADIGRVTGLPTMYRMLDVPAENWQEVVEDAAQQEKIATLLARS